MLGGKGVVLSGVGAVVHEEKVELADVVDEESLVAGGHHVAGLLVGSVTDLGHDGLSLEATAHGIVNTLGLSPAGVYAHEAVRLVAGEARSACKSITVSGGLPDFLLRRSYLSWRRSLGMCLGVCRTRGLVAPWMGGRTLLDDRDMLLCGGHLYEKSRSVMLFSWQSERVVYRTVSDWASCRWSLFKVVLLSKESVNFPHRTSLLGIALSSLSAPAPLISALGKNPSFILTPPLVQSYVTPTNIETHSFFSENEASTESP